ncbi:SHOCT domain-containing protein [Tsukamurella soli]|uniref:SHOCT domain-containing protein n=1 Tax=Tsukamurella soli TaxID=644556 RepID=A0ABP8JQS5_9ACTN
MTAAISPEAQNTITDIAERHGLSRDAVTAMLLALRAGGGTMAQFSIPELGGSGQWMRGGMTMVGGNMFDNALKARVDSLCAELSQLLATTTVFDSPTASAQAGASTSWWPADLGVPSASGGQNDARYAVFPGTRRLAIRIDGTTKVFDTGEHRIGGVQQQQGGGYGEVRFTSQLGTFAVSSLPELGAQQVSETPAAAPAPKHRSTPGTAPQVAPEPTGPVPRASEPTPATPGTPDDPSVIVATIESLAELHRRGILTDDEFAAKKAELLGRL